MYVMTTQQNQHKVWLPMNSITENIWYTDEEDKNMRMIVGAPTDHPVVWKVSKVENAEPLGVQKLTLYQCEYNQHKDYIERDKDGKVIGMWADYFEYKDEIVDLDIPAPVIPAVECKIKTSTLTLKIGGSYKTLSAEFFDQEGNNITNKYSDASATWSFIVDDRDISDILTISNGDSIKIKIKFPNDRSYLNKTLDVRCSLSNNSSIYGDLKLGLTI